MPDAPLSRALLESEYPQLAGCDVACDRVPGGLSGAGVWRLQADARQFCLRQWPPGVTSQRLYALARLLARCQTAGLTWLAVPLPTRGGRPYFESQSHLWELTPWLPGVADFHACPSSVRLRAACTAAATFHRVAAEVVAADASDLVSFGEFRVGQGRSPSLVERAARLDALVRPGAIDRSLRIAARGPWAPWLMRLAEHLPAGVRAQQHLVRWAARQQVTLQPVIRDLWHAHLLFTQDEVTGIVDFGAARTDSVAADLARMLGSLVADDASRWHEGLAAYNALRPLSVVERDLIAAFDASGVVLAAVHWIEWLHGEDREFGNPSLVRQRLEALEPRLARLAVDGSPAERSAPAQKIWTPP